MAKKRRTREQKKLADQHRLAQNVPSTVEQSIPQQSAGFTYSLQNFSHPTQPQSIIKSNTNTLRVSTVTVAYQYAKQDLRKTFLTTLAIILAQIVLFIVFKK